VVVRVKAEGKSNISSTDLANRDDVIVLAQATTQETQQEQPVQDPATASAQTAAEPKITLIQVEDGSIVHLPEGTGIDQPRMNGADLEFVQADGSIVVIPNGAITGLTLFVGNIEIPPQTVAALFEANSILPAAGPDGGNAGGSHPNFQDGRAATVGDGLTDGSLLDNSDTFGTTTAASRQAEVNVAPNLFAQTYVGTLSEEFLADGFPEAGDAGGVVLVGTVRASDVGPLAFTFGTPSALTSGGVAILWTGVNTSTLIGTANGQTIIVATINSGGTYTVKLHGPVDQPAGLGENSIELLLPITARDSGGLTNTTNLTVTLTDDVPVAVNDTNAVTEDAGTGAGKEGLGEGAITVTGNVVTTGAGADHMGADGFKSIAWTAAEAGKIGGTYGALTVGADGSYSYSLNNAAANVQGLRAGHQVTETFTYTVTDKDGDTSTATLTVTVTGTNDIPTIVGATNPAAIVETDAAQDIAAVSGTLVVSDLDIGDDLTGQVAGDATAKLNGGELPKGVDVSALLASGAISFNEVISDGGQKTITWTYDPTAANLNWLAKGDTLTITYIAQVNDDHGAVGNQPLTITIIGTNDVPTIEADTGTVSERAGQTISLDLGCPQRFTRVQGSRSQRRRSFGQGPERRQGQRKRWPAIRRIGKPSIAQGFEHHRNRQGRRL
jgi:T1SS-143 domain-containing protein